MDATSSGGNSTLLSPDINENKLTLDLNTLDFYDIIQLPRVDFEKNFSVKGKLDPTKFDITEIIILQKLNNDFFKTLIWEKIRIDDYKFFGTTLFGKEEENDEIKYYEKKIETLNNESLLNLVDDIFTKKDLGEGIEVKSKNYKNKDLIYSYLKFILQETLDNKNSFLNKLLISSIIKFKQKNNFNFDDFDIRFNYANSYFTENFSNLMDKKIKIIKKEKSPESAEKIKQTLIDLSRFLSDKANYQDNTNFNDNSSLNFYNFFYGKNILEEYNKKNVEEKKKFLLDIIDKIYDLSKERTYDDKNYYSKFFTNTNYEKIATDFIEVITKYLSLEDYTETEKIRLNNSIRYMFCMELIIKNIETLKTFTHNDKEKKIRNCYENIRLEKDTKQIFILFDEFIKYLKDLNNVNPALQKIIREFKNQNDILKKSFDIEIKILEDETKTSSSSSSSSSSSDASSVVSSSSDDTSSLASSDAFSSINLNNINTLITDKIISFLKIVENDIEKYYSSTILDRIIEELTENSSRIFEIRNGFIQMNMVNFAKKIKENKFNNIYQKLDNNYGILFGLGIFIMYFIIFLSIIFKYKYADRVFSTLFFGSISMGIVFFKIIYEKVKYYRDKLDEYKLLFFILSFIFLCILSFTSFILLCVSAAKKIEEVAFYTSFLICSFLLLFPTIYLSFKSETEKFFSYAMIPSNGINYSLPSKIFWIFFYLTSLLTTYIFMYQLVNKEVDKEIIGLDVIYLFISIITNFITLPKIINILRFLGKNENSLVEEKLFKNTDGISSFIYFIIALISLSSFIISLILLSHNKKKDKDLIIWGSLVAVSFFVLIIILFRNEYKPLEAVSKFFFSFESKKKETEEEIKKTNKIFNEINTLKNKIDADIQETKNYADKIEDNKKTKVYEDSDKIFKEAKDKYNQISTIYENKKDKDVGQKALRLLNISDKDLYDTEIILRDTNYINMKITNIQKINKDEIFKENTEKIIEINNDKDKLKQTLSANSNLTSITTRDVMKIKLETIKKIYSQVKNTYNDMYEQREKIKNKKNEIEIEKNKSDKLFALAEQNKTFIELKTNYIRNNLENDITPLLDPLTYNKRKEDYERSYFSRMKFWERNSQSLPIIQMQPIDMTAPQPANNPPQPATSIQAPHIIPPVITLGQANSTSVQTPLQPQQLNNVQTQDYTIFSQGYETLPENEKIVVNKNNIDKILKEVSENNEIINKNYEKYLEDYINNEYRAYNDMIVQKRKISSGQSLRFLSVSIARIYVFFLIVSESIINPKNQSNFDKYKSKTKNLTKLFNDNFNVIVQDANKAEFKPYYDTFNSYSNQINNINFN
jgi:hypothetical protein